MVKNCYKLLKIGILGNGLYFFAWDYMRLHQIAAKHTNFTKWYDVFYSL